MTNKYACTHSRFQEQQIAHKCPNVDARAYLHILPEVLNPRASPRACQPHQLRHTLIVLLLLASAQSIPRSQRAARSGAAPTGPLTASGALHPRAARAGRPWS